MNMLPYLKSLSVACLIASQVTSGAPDTRVYYFPMLSNTSEAVTISNIEEKYDITSIVRTDLSRIRHLLAQSEEGNPPTAFDKLQVRLKLVAPDHHTTMLDLYGVVWEDGHLRRLSLETRKQLRKVILDCMPKD